MTRARALVFGLAALPLALWGCSYFGEQPGPYRAGVMDTRQRHTGETLYLRDCAWCHGDNGEGTARGPDLVSGTNGPAFTDFMLSTGRMPITSPDEPSRHRPPEYDAAKRRAIVEHVAGFGGAGPDIPEVHAAEGDLGEGLELYQENCAACHSPTLIGGALATGPATASRSLIAPELRASTPVEIAEAMRVGPGAMPVFGEDAFSAHEVDSIVRYVSDLQDPRDRGGAPIGHIGPVAEGAVAWLVGLGAMVLLVRWIGTKRGEE